MVWSSRKNGRVWWSSKFRTLNVGSCFSFGQPKETWNEVIKGDLKEWKISKDLTKDKNTLKSFLRNHLVHAGIENRR